jgi:glycosyltransferase involved in cell wall biosynthesis
MGLKLKIIIPTQKNKDEFISTNTYKCLENITKNKEIYNLVEYIKIEIAFGNKTGLSELYQNYLNDSDDDYVLFMHDDLEIHDQFLVEKLLKAHESYDIVGLAGATTQDYTKDVPMVWHLSRERPEHSRGIVNHYIPKGFNGVSETHINSAYFGPTPAPVVVIDGLFMSFKMSSLKGKGEVFNRNYTFHHYDLAACVNANDMNLKIGVWPIFVIHYGLGEFAEDKTWQRHAQEFKRQYGHRKLSL